MPIVLQAVVAPPEGSALAKGLSQGALQRLGAFRHLGIEAVALGAFPEQLIRC